MEPINIHLPIFCRHVAVTLGDATIDADGTSHAIPGLLRNFSGVLNVGVAVGGWPVPAISHLTLDRLAAAALAESERRPRSSRDWSGTTTDPGAEESDESVPEPRVREIIRPDADQFGQTSGREYQASFEMAGPVVPSELGVLVDHSALARTVNTEKPARPAPERSAVADRSVVDRSDSDEDELPKERVWRAIGRRQETGDTEAGRPAEPMRREAVQRDGPDRSGAVESTTSSDLSGINDEPVTGAVDRRFQRNLGSDDRSEILDEQGNIDWADNDPRISLRTPSSPTIPGSIERQRDGPPTTVARYGQRLLATRRHNPESVPGRSQSRSRLKRERAEELTAGGDRFLRNEIRSSPGEDRESVGRRNRMEPLGRSIPTASEMAPRTMGAERVPLGQGDWATGPRELRSPRMAVRRDDGSDGDTGGDDSGNGPANSSTGAAEAAGSTSSRQPRGTADRDRSGQPQRIDEFVDVERLADRLARVLERRDRIERERRGR